MNKKLLGSGSKALRLRSIVGFDEHIMCKNRFPQHSFGPQGKIIPKSSSPGPGAYKIEGITRYGYNRAHQYTIGGLTPITEKSRGPGPAAYNIRKMPGADALAFGLKSKNYPPIPSAESPPPNTYKIEISLTKPSQPKYSLGRTLPKKETPTSPGPATYGRSNLNSIANKSPAYSLGARNVYSFKSCSPAANSYNISCYQPGNNPPAYSFGMRHTGQTLLMCA